VFPDGSAWKLLKMITYFYRAANDRADDSEDRLVKELGNLLGREFKRSVALNAAAQVRRIYGKRRNGHLDNDELVSAVREKLCLESTAEAQRAIVPLLGYSDTVEEHGAVVILTCTLLEKLLDELLVLMLQVREGDCQRQARESIDRLRGLDDRKEEFKRISKDSIKNAIGQSSIAWFWDKWCKVISTRNRFVHGAPYAIDASAAEDAFQLAKSSVSVFAFLQNLTCLDLESRSRAR
jgi:hypothetical protein